MSNHPDWKTRLPQSAIKRRHLLYSVLPIESKARLSREACLYCAADDAHNSPPDATGGILAPLCFLNEVEF
jgi:hypothetical protein